jgi:hypothetical protein
MTPSRKKKILLRVCLVFAAFGLTMILLEIGLRLAGFIPGYFPIHHDFKPVKKLVVEAKFQTDGDGVFKANPDFAWPPIEVNSEGFRGGEFALDEAGRSILFLGDSFTWGASAEPITNCFVDLVREQGYTAYNTGIPGACPTQYAALGEQYIPRLKPGIVAVMFYMGNDFMHQPMEPNKPLYHITNAGWIYAYTPDGTHLRAQQAHNFYMDQSNYFGWHHAGDSPTAMAQLRDMALQSVLGTYFWANLSRLRSKPADSHDSPLSPSVAANADGNAAKNHRAIVSELERIRETCRVNNAEFQLFLIPVAPRIETPENNIDQNLKWFADFDPLTPDSLTEADYERHGPYPHFNNAGHEKYARFVLQQLALDSGK